ncbi:preprotein translocase subunit SecE [Candidatus Peregrinibacteria bacterium]|jgi:preprotein translocase subunit SecE|nr:preprotein translocase subunit SecE [Candidatus Peregrinibacteria bacterium]MBT7483486.1 preprotein translocase subunit SecE [Candidatus Peregrinibacteria bacterium]MBT7702793.1 preprotein translocase subunit SecE [Candidatus Peregrinibacteria bacterium]
MKKSNAMVAYFKNSFNELRKVTWPTKEQTLRLTIIVSIFSLIVAFFFGVLDYVFNVGFTELLNLI